MTDKPDGKWWGDGSALNENQRSRGESLMFATFKGSMATKSIATLYRLVVVLVLIGVSVRQADAQSMPPVLNPKTYRAPAGRYELTVDPSEEYGCGEATYRLSFAGSHDRWSKTLPFALCEASVTDDGLVTGYAYTRSPAGFPDFGGDKGHGDFVVVMLDANGATRLKDSVKRRASNFLHAWPEPLAHGLIVDPANDRVIVRVANADINRGHEYWWIYRLSTATAVAKLAPADLMSNAQPARWILGARPIPGTPLTLVHWWRFDWRTDRNSVGARFTLVDLDLKPVWSMELPKDYTIPGNEKASDELREFIREHGGILRNDEPGRFDLYFAADGKRVTFSVKQATAGKWVVTEVARAPYQPARSEERAPDKIPIRPLKSLAPIVLQGHGNSNRSPFRNAYNFVFDGEGRIAFVGQDGSERPTFVLAKQTGKVLRETPLKIDLKPDERWDGYCWVGGSRFVITSSEPGHDKMARGWWIDALSGQLEPIAGFDCPPVNRLVGFGDGTFVALATMRYKYTLEHLLIGFDKPGHRTWTIKKDYNSKEPSALFSPEDIAAPTRGEIVVLDNIRAVIQSFDRAGHFRSRIDLSKAWGRKPNYPSRISGDPDGGFLIEDSGGSPPFVRMRPDGTIRSEFTAKQPDGRPLDVHDGIQAAPDGRLWACDGYSIVRLTDAGIVDRVLGQAPEGRQLGQIAGITVDRQGQIYAVESRTGSIHVFDVDGKLKHVCETKPTDFKGELRDPAITVRDRGEIYLRLASGRFARFSPDGTRLKDEDLPVGDSPNKCLFQPGTDRIVAIGNHDVSLIDPSVKTVRTIRRRPDGNWLAWINEVVFAADGSMAILVDTHGDYGNGRHVVCLYRSSGDPICTIVLPKDADILTQIAYNGRRVVATAGNGLIIYDGSGRPLQRSAYGSKPDKTMYYHPYFLPGGRTLALFDGKGPALYRYELP